MAGTDSLIRFVIKFKSAHTIDPEIIVDQNYEFYGKRGCTATCPICSGRSFYPLKNMQKYAFFIEM